MEKIITVTFHNANNYGAMLQSYALQKKISEKYKTVILNYDNHEISNNYKIFKKVSKNPLKTIYHLIFDILHYNNNKKRYISFERFRKKLKLTEYFDNTINIPNDDQESIYITGSDQVWNPRLTNGLDEIYTLNAFNSSKKISYAASVGDSNIIIENSEEYKRLINDINNLSVREEDAKAALEKVLNKKVDVVLDPTLLLTKEQWNNEIETDFSNDKEYIFAYVVKPDDEYVKIVNYLSEKTGLGIIHCGLNNIGYKNVIKTIYTSGPLEFINYIKNAKYVVTTSFHATVFSIIFEKKFFVIPHRQTGARVVNLLNGFGLSERSFGKLEEFEKTNYDKDINYDEVNKILDKEREQSIKWLFDAIENNRKKV